MGRRMISPPPRAAARRRWRRLPLYAVLLLGHAPSWAQNHTLLAARDLTDIPLESLMTLEVQSVSKFRQAAKDAPAAVSVLTAQEIKTYGWRTLAEILNSLPGIYITNDRTYTHAGTRGFLRAGDYNMRLLLMIDGHRTNDPLYDQAMVGQEFMLDVDLIDRVEYVPGPGSAIYGSNAFFGIINVITKRGRDFQRGQVSAEAGSAGLGAGRATLGGLSEQGIEWLISASAYNSSGRDLHFAAVPGATPPFPGGTATRLDFERTQRVFAKLEAGPINLTLAHAERTKGNPSASFGQAFNNPDSRTVDTSSYLDAGYRSALSATTDLSARLFYNRYRYTGTFVYPAADMHKDQGKADWWGGELKLVNTALAEHKLVGGVEYQRNAPLKQWEYTVSPYSLNMSLRNTNQRFGIYVQDEWSFHPDWLLSMGLRADWNNALADKDAINPRLGLIYKFSPQTTAKLLSGRAYRVPNAYELYYGDGVSQKGNAGLQPERIRTNELVFEHQWAENSRVRWSLYQNSVKDLITQISDPADNLLVYQNIGRATVKGSEIEWQQAWQGGTRLRTSASWQKATDDTTGATLANAPHWLGKLNMSTPFWHDQWRAGAEVQYVSTRNTLQSARLGSYTVSNLTLFSDKLYPGIEVSASVYNLFNRRYAVPVGPEFVQDALLQDGRTFRVKLSYNF